jgi:hypothetical protein
VVAANYAAARLLAPLLEGPEIAADIRAPELIVECGGAQGRRDHDVERRGDSFRLAKVVFPGLNHPRNPQIRYRVAGQAGFGLGADSGRTFIANLAPCAGGGTGKGRNRRRMIVGLDLHQNIDGLVHAHVTARRRIGKESRGAAAFDDSGVVPVRREHAAGIAGIRGADHREQRQRHGLTVDDELGIEYLVPAMLRVRLREHHELDIGGIAP